MKKNIWVCDRPGCGKKTEENHDVAIPNLWAHLDFHRQGDKLDKLFVCGDCAVDLSLWIQGKMQFDSKAFHKRQESS